VDKVYQNTQGFLRDIGRSEIPHFRGGTPDQPESPAARFLADTVAKNPGEITLLATGALTNLYGAHQSDPTFFQHLAHVVAMGGITSPLVINGHSLDELNFSCDPRAAHAVLTSSVRRSVITANLCLQVLFGDAEFRRLEENRRVPACAYLLKPLRSWRTTMEKVFGLKGFYNWDTTAAVYVTDPSLFRDERRCLTSTLADLQKGLLRTEEASADGSEVNMPSAVTDPDEFNRRILEAWGRVSSFPP
jgi:inosine-uridine nucleoside N-ribohydrolase